MSLLLFGLRDRMDSSVLLYDRAVYDGKYCFAVHICRALVKLFKLQCLVYRRQANRLIAGCELNHLYEFWAITSWLRKQN